MLMKIKIKEERKLIQISLFYWSFSNDFMAVKGLKHAGL